VKEIPAPPAVEGTDINYDELYSLEFHQPDTYIRFSDTVEEACGCPYDMTTEDDVFLKAFNQKKTPSHRCSEEKFEKIMDVFELTAQSHAPFAAVDNTVVPFDKMKPELIKQEMGDSTTPLRVNVAEKLIVLAKEIYEHWRERRQVSGNNPLQPSLKFETHQENDDGDPYVCFRRRDVRPTRKTRARDVQSTDKLKKLRREIEEGRHLVALACHREELKRQVLNTDKIIFEARAKLKDAKVRLGIKGDDEDLINQRVRLIIQNNTAVANTKQPQKRKVSDYPQMQRPPGTQLRLPARPDGRPLDADLVLLSDVIAQKENLLQREIDEKTQQHRKWNANHIDLTREPLSPVNGHGPDTGFRPATAQYQYLMTPPSSVTSETFEQPSLVQENTEPAKFRFDSPEEDDNRSRPAYRRRIGRGGRLWIDRRGMSSSVKTLDDEIRADRYKFDEDDDDEQPVYEMDPYDIRALKFRATIPFPAHLAQNPRRVESSRPAGQSPPNSRPAAAAAASQPAVVAPT
jgi:enhancer of polycomb-like protein